MYRFSYADILNQPPPSARQRERLAIEHSIERLRAAMDKGSGSPEAVEAAHVVRKLWASRIDELTMPGHELPKPLRADLIAVGQWIMQEAEAVRFGRSSNLAGLIEVSQLIAEGLHPRQQ